MSNWHHCSRVQILICFWSSLRFFCANGGIKMEDVCPLWSRICSHLKKVFHSLQDITLGIYPKWMLRNVGPLATHELEDISREKKDKNLLSPDSDCSVLQRERERHSSSAEDYSLLMIETSPCTMCMASSWTPQPCSKISPVEVDISRKTKNKGQAQSRETSLECLVEAQSTRTGPDQKRLLPNWCPLTKISLSVGNSPFPPREHCKMGMEGSCPPLSSFLTKDSIHLTETRREIVLVFSKKLQIVIA